ncbi:hypothetical protein ACFE04_028307 [Oxalis oulophora]
MKSITLIHVHLTLLLVVVNLFMSESRFYQYYPFQEYSVLIINKLTNQEQLDVHCWFDKDDRGERSLPFGEVYQFTFHVNALQTTKYTCDLSYLGDRQYRATFDAFRAKRIFIYACGGEHDCIWSATHDGMYLSNTVKKTSVLAVKWTN